MVLPSDRIRGTASKHLEGRRIVLAVTGSIAAVKTVELARELIRHGADVLPVMTPAALGILTADALQFATGHRPITALTGSVEHVREMGEAGDADLLLVAPATANSIAKMALGIDDTAATTFATVAFGARRPVIIAPAMHEAMETHPAVVEHQRTLEKMGARFVTPLHEEAKAKLADVHDIVAEVTRALGPATLAGRRVLVVTGASRESLDPVRVLTNRSSGRMGRAVARAAYRHGGEVMVATTDTEGAWPPRTTIHSFAGTEELLAVLERLVREHAPDLVFVPAALSDFAPERRDTKIPSDAGGFDLHLTALPKVLPRLRELAPGAVVVGWKLEDSLPSAVAAARERMARYAVDAFVANSTEALDATETDARLVLPDDELVLSGSKERVAEALVAAVAPLRHGASAPAERAGGSRRRTGG